MGFLEQSGAERLTSTRLIAYSKWINKGLPLRLKERRQVARELHQRMYSAFAE